MLPRECPGHLAAACAVTVPLLPRCSHALTLNQLPRPSDACHCLPASCCQAPSSL